MARVAGVNIPDNKHAEISLTYVFGIGKTRSLSICSTVGIDPSTKIADLNEDGNVNILDIVNLVNLILYG